MKMHKCYYKSILICYISTPNKLIYSSTHMHPTPSIMNKRKKRGKTQQEFTNSLSLYIYIRSHI